MYISASSLASIPAEAALAKRYDIACKSDLRLTLKLKYEKIHKNIQSLYYILEYVHSFFILSIKVSKMPCAYPNIQNTSQFLVIELPKYAKVNKEPSI
jgi:hypothetical protein